MAKEFPSFIYMDSQASKVPGEFIVHTREPRFTARIDIIKGFIDCTILEVIDKDADAHVLERVREKAKYWYINNIHSKRTEREGLPIHQAFMLLLNERGIGTKLDVLRQNIHTLRTQIEKENKFPTIDQMTKLLLKGGWEVVQEQKWIKEN